MKILSSIAALSLVELSMGLFNPVWDNSTANPNNTMYQLSSDSEFHFELARVLSLAPYEGADLGESLLAFNDIVPGDFDSWTAAFTALANRTTAHANTINATAHPVSARNALLKAASYWRSADFFTHGNWSDPRITSVWNTMLDNFHRAIALYPSPGVPHNVPSGYNWTIPTYFFPSGLPGKRPTLIMGSGYDGAQEEMWHQVGLAAAQRGINVITYEGPGQQTVRRQQGVGFIPQWERVVTPVVDYALTLPGVDPNAIGLVGVSFGGYLAPRAAAYEHRLAAVIAIDGIHDFGGAVLDKFLANPAIANLWNSGNQSALDALIIGGLSSFDTQTRWFVTQGLWAFDTESPYDFLKQLVQFNLTQAEIANITMPAFIADAEQDTTAPGQAKQLADALGAKATYQLFLGADGAGLHCSLGAEVLLNAAVLDWFEDTVGGSGADVETGASCGLGATTGKTAASAAADTLARRWAGSLAAVAAVAAAVLVL